MSPAPKKPKVKPLTAAERDKRIIAAGQGRAITDVAKRARVWLAKQAEDKKENASTDYSKLRFLGQFLAEYRIRKRKDIKGQKTFDFPEQMTATRRKKAAVPRRRKDDEDSKGRAIDKPRERRAPGFKKDTEGTRKSDVPGHQKRKADAAEETAEDTKKIKKRGKRYSRAGQAYATYRVAKALLPKPRLPRAKPSGPNVRTGGTEGTVKL